MKTKTCRIPPDAVVRLSDYDSSDRSLFDGGKQESREALTNLRARLAELQRVLYAEHRHALLVVFQAMDTGGKDSVTRRVFRGVNPQGVHVVSFKSPTADELDHDFLWRVHQHAPARGQITVFNRSHYEDVLIVRVHDLAPREQWSRRYDHINTFERLLADEGATIVKFFLHISRDEQRKRLQERLEHPEKHWKFAPGDLDERKLWPEYVKAYEAVLSRTSTEHAPWYVVPADRKWYRDLVVADVLVRTLEGLDMKYPEATFNPSDFEIPR